ncbi:MAG: hypothetical protein JWO89_3173 [Verrucomicrobiaceae bacterium]|nr:hypothetical protein [Verrucomicrobiaceae bacterium]
MKLLLSAAAVFAFTACGTPSHQLLYAPPAQPASAVARLWVDQQAPLHVATVDGRQVDVSLLHPAVVDVLPGSHNVTIRSNAGGQASAIWQAKAGVIYDAATTQEQKGPGSITYGKPVVAPASAEVINKLRATFP